MTILTSSSRARTTWIPKDKMMRKLPLLMMKSSVKIHQFNDDGTNEDTRSDVNMEQDRMVRYFGEVTCINPRKIL